jgi:ribonuclease BN (tRNA processing enzyme)
MSQPTDAPFDGICLLTHLHWDHVQGLPFFGPILRPDAALELHAPMQPGGADIGTVFSEIWRPPAFPIGIDDLPVEIDFHAHDDDEFSIGDVSVMSRWVPHVGPTLGYRLEWEGHSVAYLSDHQQPGVGVFETTQGVRDLCTGADVLIHDAQYTREEFAVKSDWGHCTLDYAAWLARECGVGTLALFHHDPSHDDRTIDWLRDDLVARCDDGIKIIAAYEGLTLDLGGPVGSS